MQTAAAVTMVRDDAFFLAAWLRYYGGLLGRENCYIVNHGRGEEVSRLAEGCNVIGIPGEAHKNFDMKRWRLLNNLVMGLRSYYTHVIVGDVDELVVRDPAEGGNLLDLLRETRGRRVLTPIGLELVQRLDLETSPVRSAILGPRRHVRLAPHYSKPCIVSAGTKIARGGHYTQHDRIEVPPGLYLFHLKFCDFDAYVEAMDRRNAITSGLGKEAGEVSVGRHWFAEARGEDRAVFQEFSALPVQERFDLGWLRDEMIESFRPRGDTGYWEFDKTEHARQYRLPERFDGIF
ncbi:glycosyltransferase family 2 protein [Mesobacterium pallidum]|uniref:glycosyltransferase family 2 protein n=1 Tax=Mesobacterium pallidum TaxID=2872037 RepID=UPI001EE35ACC|nr:glycosyltransferase family 2 protein [Mesobacterium pallidum]